MTDNQLFSSSAHLKFTKLSARFGALFSILLMTLLAMKAAADINQEAANLNLVVKAITDVKKSVKATDVKPLKSTLTKSVNWPNFRTIKMVQLVVNFQWAELLKSWLSIVVTDLQAKTHFRLIHLLFTDFFLYYGAQKFLYWGLTTEISVPHSTENFCEK